MPKIVVPTVDQQAPTPVVPLKFPLRAVSSTINVQENSMTAKQLLDTARGLSKKHALQMHAWGVVRFDGADHLGLYLYEGASNVQLTLVQQCDGQADADWAKLMVDYLNNSRGLGPEGVGLFVTSYEGGRCKAGRMVKHLYP